MQNFINDSLLKDLNHPSDPQIRKKALHSISESLKNNVIFKNPPKYNKSAAQELKFVNFTILIRNLIRYFGHGVQEEESEILDLLLLIMKRSDILDHVLSTITIERLKKELEKIARIVREEESFEKLDAIDEVLSYYQRIEKTETSSCSSPSVDSLSDLLKATKITSMTEEKPNSIVKIPSKCESGFSLKYFEVLDENSKETFERLHTALQDAENVEFMEYTLDYLMASFDDFPVEFYLQEPFIFEDLIKLFPKLEEAVSVRVLKIIRHMINSLKNRIEMLQTVMPINNLNKTLESKKVISVKKFVNYLMELAVNELKLFESSKDCSLDSEEVFLELYRLLFDLVDFIHDTEEICEIYLNELLNNLAKAAKNFRIQYNASATSNKRLRVHYTIQMYLLNLFVSICNQEVISKWCDNDLWEHECDILLLDLPVQIFCPSIYKLAKSNRALSIESDDYMQTLLRNKKQWISVIELLRKHEQYRDEDVLEMGLVALDTLQIHQSLGLVQVLLERITKSSHLFFTNENLKEVSEQIFIRLISHPMVEVRKLVYQYTSKMVCSKFTDHFDKMQNEEKNPRKTLCCLIGIPLTAEILMEILCFGIRNDIPTIHKNSEMILFTILRSKVVFEPYWPLFLEVIKPALPLLPCVSSSDERLGLFAMEAISPADGFTEEEMIQAYQRFLFSKCFRVREMALQKLCQILEKRNFMDVPLEIMSANLFLTGTNCQLVDMPSSLVKFDRNACKITLDLLKSVDKNDEEIMKTILLQIKGFMGSVDACNYVHDQNAWVYIVESLNYATTNLNNPEVIKLCVDILYKLCITVTPFRKYLATEYNIQNSLLQAMIYFNNESQLKKQICTLMFLFLFNDFLVGNDKNISLPAVMKNLEIPFQFKTHWAESPFKKVSQLEAIFQEIESADDDHQLEIQGICWRYLKFVFSAFWFDSLVDLDKIENFDQRSYYMDAEENILDFNMKLLLDRKDVRYLFDLNDKLIFADVCKRFDNSVKHDQVLETITDLERALMLPFEIEQQSSTLLRKIDRFITFEPRCEEDTILYTRIVKLLNHFLVLEHPDFIAWTIKKFLNKDSIFMKILRNFKSKHYILVLDVVKNSFKSFARWDAATLKLLKELEGNCKYQLVTKIFETLVENLVDCKIKEAADMMNVRYAIIAMRKVVTTNQVHSDDTFIESVITKLFKLSSYIKELNYSGSSILKNILVIILCLLKNLKRPAPEPRYIEFLNFLFRNEDFNIRTIAWNILVEFSSRKENSEKIVKAFDSIVPEGLFCFVFETILDDKESILVKSGAVAVLGSLIEESSFKMGDEKVSDINGNDTKIGSANFPKSQDFCKTLLDKLLVEQESLTLISLKSYCYIIKKFINWNSLIISEMLSQRTVQTVFSFITTAKYLDTLSAVKMVTDACDLISFCWKLNQFQHLIQDCVVSMEKEYLNDLFIVLQMALNDESKDVMGMRIALFRNVLNVLKIVIACEEGFELIKSFLENVEYSEILLKVVAFGLRSQNRYNDLMFHLSFVNQLLESSENFEDSLCYRFEKNPVSEEMLKEILKYQIIIKPDSKQMNSLPIKTMIEENCGLVTSQIDVILIEILDIYDFVDFSKHSFEYKYDMKGLCFWIIKLFAEKSENLSKIFEEVDIFSLICKKFNLIQIAIGGSRYLDATKKMGAKKCNHIIKDFALLLRIVTEWRITAEEKLMKEFFLNILKVYDWIEQDSVLLNNFYNFCSSFSKHRYARSFLMESLEGPNKPLIKCLTEKILQLTTKTPHTESNLTLMKNAFNVLVNACQFMEVRLTLKTIYQVLDTLHPQLMSSKKTSWDDVTLIWLSFIEEYSQYEETEIQSGQVSVLCRILRIGNASIREVCLRIIRNFSLKASIGTVLLSSDDFLKTAGALMLKETDAIEDKYLITMTFLSVCSKCERLKAKLKNTPLRGIFRNVLAKMQCDSEASQKLYNIISILNRVLEPNE